jgi:hypothetical protein
LFLVNVGVLLLLFGALCIYEELAFPAQKNEGPFTRTPTRELLRRAHESANPASAAILAEVTRRLRRGEGIPPEDVSLLVERAFAWQTNRTELWSSDWGQLVEASRDRGLVSDAEWRRYARQVAEPTPFRARRPVRQGDPVETVAADWIPTRGGASRRFVIEADPVRVQVGGVDAVSMPWPDSVTLETSKDRAEPTWSSRLAYSDSPTIVRGRYSPSMVILPSASLGPGDHIILVDVKWTIRDASSRAVLVEEHRDLTARVELLPKDASIATFDDDPGVASRMRATVAISEVYIHAERPLWVFTLDYPPESPVGLACAVFFRAKGREWRAGDLLVERWAGFSPDPSAPFDLPDVETLDVILRPNPAIAYRADQQTRFLGRELVFQGVRINREN